MFVVPGFGFPHVLTVGSVMTYHWLDQNEAMEKKMDTIILLGLCSFCFSD